MIDLIFKIYAESAKTKKKSTVHSNYAQSL